KAAWELIEKIDAMGGSVAAIENSFMQNEIAHSAYEYQRNIESGEKIIVGVNKFQVKEGDETPVFKVDEKIQQQQSERLRALRSSRDQEKVQQALTNLS